MSIFLKFSICCIIIAKTTYFENIQYCKIYFHYGLSLIKTCYNDSASFFGRYFHFKFRFFSKMSIFLKFSNCRIIIAHTTYFENIQYCKISFHYGPGLAKTSYNDSASLFWKIFRFKISIFFKKIQFLSKFSNCRVIIVQTTYFENIQYSKIYFHYGLGLTKTS